MTNEIKKRNKNVTGIAKRLYAVRDEMEDGMRMSTLNIFEKKGMSANIEEMKQCIDSLCNELQGYKNLVNEHA